MTRDEVFEALRARGVATVHISFSGGGDSGGVDDVMYLDKNDDILKEIDLVKKENLCFYKLSYPPKKDEQYKQLVNLLSRGISIYGDEEQATLLNYYALADYIDDKYADIPEMVKTAATIRDLAEVSIIRTALEKPVFDEYYSFAGDFNVSGDLTWDVKNKTVQMSGSEFVPNSFTRTL